MKDPTAYILGAVVLAFIVSIPACDYVVSTSNEHTKTIVVRKAERVSNGKSSKYLVYTEGGDTYKVTDSMWYWTWDASDRYGKVLPGHTYECEVAGVRWPWLSAYPNLVTVTEVKDAM